MVTKLASWLVSVSFALVVLNCDNNTAEDGAIEVNFIAQFDKQPLTMFADQYDYEGDAKVSFQLFQFYVSSIRLINEDGQPGPEIKDIALINFGDIQDKTKAAEGVNVNIAGVPVGNYSGIQLGIGVNNALNGTTPNEYEAGHPLSGHYWDAASSYIFTKIEGNADLNNDNSFEQKLTFHIGGNPRYREVKFDFPMTVESNKSEKVGFIVDVKDIFVGDDGSFIDFGQVTQIHDGTAPLAVEMMDRFALSLSLQN